MKSLAMFAAVVMLSASTALADWPLEPKDFRGIPFPGASTADVAKKLGRKPRSCTAASCVDYGFKFDDVQVISLYGFKDDRLVTITLSFDSSSYDKVKGILIERYGPPTLVETIPIKTRMGVEYQNETILWAGEVIKVNLVQLAGSVDKSLVMLLDIEHMAELEKAAEEAKKKAATTF
jgi:hypothetical protein